MIKSWLSDIREMLKFLVLCSETCCSHGAQCTNEVIYLIDKQGYCRVPETASLSSFHSGKSKGNLPIPHCPPGYCTQREVQNNELRDIASFNLATEYFIKILPKKPLCLKTICGLDAHGNSV